MGDTASMKKLAAVIFIFGSLVFNAFGQSNTSTRPRVAATPTPRAPVLQNEQRPSASSASRPPVLTGNSRQTSPLPTPKPVDDGENEIIKVETNLVTMPVSVLDRDGRYVSGLQQRDFQIYENGIEQKVDYFQSVETPFTVVMLIDVSPSTQFRIDEIQNAAVAFIDQLRPNDRVMVISFDENVNVLSPITNNRYQLKNAIRNLQFGDGTSLYEAVDYVINQEMSKIQGRKAVVLFSDGVDTTSRRASFQSTVAMTEEVDSLFYTIRYDTSRDMNSGGSGNNNPYPQPSRRNGRVSMADILGAILSGGDLGMGGGSGNRRGGGAAGSSPADYETGRKYLEAIALKSGGRKFEAQSITNVTAAFSGIAEELRRQYSLGYYPVNVGTVGERKQIKVRVMRQGVVVRAKNSYIVGQNSNVAGR